MILQEPYESLRKRAARDLKSPDVSDAIGEIVRLAVDFLAKRCDRIELTSPVKGKSYFAFCLKGKQARFSRPVNRALFDSTTTLRLFSRITSGKVTEVTGRFREQALYTAAMSYCCVTDLLKADDRKTPATFFEIFVGHLIARAYDTNPRNQIDVLARSPTDRHRRRAPIARAALRVNRARDLTDQAVQEALVLPTDFVFDLGPNRSRIHVPVKLSTRERIIQVWAHQRVLDGVYGINAFRALLVCLTETNMVRKTMSVVEVCLPAQWRIYQMFIAQLFRVYYFDPPALYAPLAESYPYIQVKHFSSFFDEWERLVLGPPGG